jgi:F-type H+/Na+-transporting ATPase subunit alpha
MATDTTLRPGEIKDILLREIEAADLHALDVEEVGTVLEVKDGIARIYGLHKAMAGEMLELKASETGNVITGLALNLEEDNIGAVVLGDYLQLKEGDEVRRTARVLEVPVGPSDRRSSAASSTRSATRWTSRARSRRRCRARSSRPPPASSSGSR